MLRPLFFLICLFMSWSGMGQKTKFNKSRVVQNGFFVEIPYSPLKNKIIIPVTIEGNVYQFLFDTGAPNVISHRLLDQIEVKAKKSIDVKDANNESRKLDVVQIPALELGGVLFKNSKAIVNDHNSDFLFSCLKIDGIIGSNLVRNSIVQIDSGKNTIIFTDQEEKLQLNNVSYIDMALDANQSSPYLWIRLAGKSKAKEQVLFDTGAEGFYDLSSSRYSKLKEIGVFSHIDSADGYKGIGLFGVTAPSLHYRVQVPTIEIVNAVFKNVIGISTASRKSRIGADLLNYGRVTLNFSDKKFYFEPFNIISDLEEKVWSISPSVRNEQVVVGIVWETGDLKNINVGDQIIKINEVDVVSQGVCDLLVRSNSVFEKEQLSLVLKDSLGHEKKIQLLNYNLKQNVNEIEGD